MGEDESLGDWALAAKFGAGRGTPARREASDGRVADGEGWFWSMVVGHDGHGNGILSPKSQVGGEDSDRTEEIGRERLAVVTRESAACESGALINELSFPPKHGNQALAVLTAVALPARGQKECEDATFDHSERKFQDQKAMVACSDEYFL